MQSKKQNTRDLRKLPRWSLLLYAIALLALLLYVLTAVIEPFADWYNRTVGAALRALLAHLTSFLPFSLAEILLYCMPLLVVGLSVLAYRRYCESWRTVLVYLGSIVSVFSLLFSLFAFGFGAGYQTQSLERRLDLPAAEVSAVSLRTTADRLVEELNVLAPHISYNGSGFSDMPYDLDGLNDALIAAYDPLCDQYPFIQRLNSRVKPVLASKLMSYTHITGVYSYYTGEANVNVHFPDYTLPFTAAHELAHQRGIARENEANFIAFLVCVGSQDSYVRYSGYLNLLEYICNALYRADVQAYREILQALDERVLGELRAYSDFFDAFRDSPAADVSDAVNDTYLKLNGNEAGTASYGLVVELAVAYYAVH